MKSVLTRRIFRQLLLNEPVPHRACLRCIRRPAIGIMARPQVRTIFGFGEPNPENEVRAPTVDPNLALMTELSERLRLRLRPHPREDVLEAFKNFVAPKTRRSHASTMTDIQVEHCLATLDHLRKTGSDDESGLELSVLEHALRSLVHPTLQNAKRHLSSDERRLELARLLYTEAAAKERQDPDTGRRSTFEKRILFPYLKVLGTCGRGAEALVVLDGYLQINASDSDNRSLWNQVIRGTARPDNQQETEGILQMMSDKGIPFNAVTQQVIIETLAAQDAMEAVVHWFLKTLPDGEAPLKRVKQTVAELCMKHEKLEVGKSVIAAIAQDPDLGLEDWNILVSWAIATGKGVEEVDRQLDVMQRRSRELGNPLKPDASTINALMRTALWQSNGYLAERILNYGRERDIKPNAATWIMQVDHRLDQGDYQGAVEAYGQVRDRAFEIENDEDAPSINRLIELLSRQREPNMKQIVACVRDLAERKLPFDPATVAALAIAHMRQDELHDAIDLLRTHAKDFDHSARSMIRDKLVEYCLDPKTEEPLAWDAYIIVHELFGETPRATRETIMTSFFQRERPDMAIHVFGHMRQFALPEKRPSAQSYQKCFEGIAGAGGDEEYLDIVHNMLKLDYEVDPDTRVNNALMMAQVAAGRPDVALRLWNDIIESEEGPTYMSIRIAFMACETHPEGEEEARRLWNRLNSIGVEVTQDIYTSYLWALAGSGNIDEAQSMIDNMATRFGSGPTAVTLGTLYNVARPRNRVEDVASWSASRYPDAWAVVEASGKNVLHDLMAFETYKIERGVHS